jgi:hypothetical protein
MVGDRTPPDAGHCAELGTTAHRARSLTRKTATTSQHIATPSPSLPMILVIPPGIQPLRCRQIHGSKAKLLLDPFALLLCGHLCFSLSPSSTSSKSSPRSTIANSLSGLRPPGSSPITMVPFRVGGSLPVDSLPPPAVAPCRQAEGQERQTGRPKQPNCKPPSPQAPLPKGEGRLRPLSPQVPLPDHAGRTDDQRQGRHQKSPVGVLPSAIQPRLCQAPMLMLSWMK